MPMLWPPLRGQLLSVLLTEGRHGPHQLAQHPLWRDGHLGTWDTFDALQRVATAGAPRVLYRRIHQRQVPSEFPAGEDAVCHGSHLLILHLLAVS